MLLRYILCVIGTILPLSFPALAIEKPGVELEEVGINPVLGARISLDAELSDSSGSYVNIRDLLSRDIPTILVPAYYNCPKLCGLLLDGVKDLVKELPLELGREYQIVTVSFDPKETLAAAERTAKRYRTAVAGEGRDPLGWRFLFGDQQVVERLMRDIGFTYREDRGDFAHTAALVILTGAGEISQYFTGIHFPAGDVRLALVEASKGRIGSALDHILLFCFRFDPTKGRYTWAAFGVMRAGGLATILLLGGLIFYLRRREKRLRSFR